MNVLMRLRSMWGRNWVVITGRFIDRMNKRAKELGCTDTHFNNCNGLPDEDHWGQRV